MEWWTSDYWSESYKNGRWDYLWGDEQWRRYRIIHSWCETVGSTSLLDVGGGEGVLLKDLPSGKIKSYLGLDFSAEAIRSATTTWRDHPFAKFEISNAEKLSERVWQEFDTIVFNEILYSLHDPMEMLHRIVNQKNPQMDRWVITSVYFKQERLQKTIRTLFQKNIIAAENAVFDQASGGWYLLLLKNSYKKAND
jgi:2-polyprenyl-3-methyl-5-hydroxy-6-metoxy-1,4-benzoquinol methylase